MREPSLTVEQVAVLRAIVKGKEAWSVAVALAEAYGAEVMCELTAGGWIEPWESPAGLVVTLTPWGAHMLSVVLAEHDERFAEQRGNVVVRVISECPEWCEAHVVGRKCRCRACRPKVARKYGLEVDLPFPELVPDPHESPDQLMDEFSGEPVRLFVSDLRPNGVTVSTQKRRKPGRAG